MISHVISALYVVGQGDGARERAERALAPVEGRLRFLRLRLAPALDGKRVLMDRQIDVVELHARNLGGDDDAVGPAPDVDRREFGRRNPPLIAKCAVDLVLDPTQR